MKRTPLSRGKGLVRKTALKARESLRPTSGPQRSELRRVSPRKVDRRPGYDYQQFVLTVCFDRIRGTYHRKPCVVCGAPAYDAHHVIPKQRIEAMAHRLGVTTEEKVELLMDQRNGLALCSRCHDRHEHGPSRAARVPFFKLSLHNVEFASRLDRKLKTEENMVFLERTYPR